MSDNKARTELIEVTGVKPKEGEDEKEFLARILTRANNLKDDQWKSLSEASQRWVNEAVGAVEKKEPLPPLGKPNASDGGGAKTEAKPNGKADSKPSTSKKSTAGKKKASAASTKPTASAKKPAKTAKKASDAKGANGRGRKGSYELDAKITLKQKDSPHRKGSSDAKKYDALKTGMTVGTALATKKVDWGYLRYAVGRGIIAIK